MLHFTKEMLDSLGEQSGKSFEHRMCLHLREFFSARCKAADDGRLGDFIHAAVQKARSYGFVRECEVAKFIDLMVALNPYFDTDPQMPWARPILTDAQRTPEERLNAIYRMLLQASGIRSFAGTAR